MPRAGCIETSKRQREIYFISSRKLRGLFGGPSISDKDVPGRHKPLREEWMSSQDIIPRKETAAMTPYSEAYSRGTYL